MFGRKHLKKERKIYTSGYRPENDKDKLLSFSVKEAYKTVRTNIVLSLIKDGCKIITFTSPIPSEGKSTTISNIAVSLSKAFYKVLLIDCDLLKPRLHKTFKIKNQSGISNVLSKLSTFEESVQVLDEYSGLHILTAGIAVPNSSEMLGSDRMKKTLEELSEKYDYILLDTPPINVISDGLNLSRISDGVVVVVRQDHSTHDELKHAINSLKFISAKILGIVFNGAEEQGQKSRYGKSSKYGNYGKYGKYSSYSYASTYGDKERKNDVDDKVIEVDNSFEESNK
ncbi:MAG: CpsD/CapB family tyrosine-protein kinase [Clostridia bacterium]|nr:CpsD/CapB family tyrosine-protein kinase [Clostridia bacterium]